MSVRLAVAVDDVSVSVASRRLNVGCGEWPLAGWTNLDAVARPGVDTVAAVPPLPYADASLDDIYCGHVLEHLTPAEAGVLLDECRRCLVPGGRLGVVVPDTREILRRYLESDATTVQFPAGVWRPVADLDEVCALFLYSTVQTSPHRWSYDAMTLRRLLEAHRFRVTAPIDRMRDPRIPVGAWYQFGWDAEPA